MRYPRNHDSVTRSSGSDPRPAEIELSGLPVMTPDGPATTTGRAVSSPLAGSPKRANEDASMAQESSRAPEIAESAKPVEPAKEERPTIWGLDPGSLHDYYWASRAVQVLRPGDAHAPEPRARFFLLCPRRVLVKFRLGRLANMLAWMKPDVLEVAVKDSRERGPREYTITDEHFRLRRFQRLYDRPDSHATRVLLTTNPKVAELWRSSPSDPRADQAFSRGVSSRQIASTTVTGKVYDSSHSSDLADFARDLVSAWKHPDSTVARPERVQGDVWADPLSSIGRGARCVGPVWIGAGRKLSEGTAIAGPTILWDEPGARPRPPEIEWDEIRAKMARETLVLAKRPRPRGYRGKRALDIALSSLGLAMTLPLYPLIMLLIWLQDGRPFFFAHRRQTFGGREFPCVKFRTMRRDAEEIKKKLMAENQADGPQFFMENDPRLLPCGWFLRKTNLDELPQFINVLRGEMSVVGPRPSPRAENQCCPPWREARLSVRPGITGFWQVMRTREEGMDFQEWIRYDLEYVERASWSLDLFIISKTILILLKLND